MARVYAEVNENMPRSYWDYDSVNISKLFAAMQDDVSLYMTAHLMRGHITHPVSFDMRTHC
jgi:hypothetical protein